MLGLACLLVLLGGLFARTAPHQCVCAHTSDYTQEPSICPQSLTLLLHLPPSPPPAQTPPHTNRQATRGAVELAAATLCTLSQRPSAHELLLSEGAIPALISLLTPSHRPRAVADAASALGNTAADAGCRRAARAAGAVGALVQLLRPDAGGARQAAAAGALCLLAARDAVVQDSVRYLGGVDLLVDLLASERASLAEVARWVWGGADTA